MATDTAVRFARFQAAVGQWQRLADDISARLRGPVSGAPKKNEELRHLRKMQSVGFVERAAIRVVELFSHKNIAC